MIDNETQANADTDSHGDLCDNCPDTDNEAQEDFDADGVGDSCDNCIYDYNPDQEDADGDDIGDSCDVETCCRYVGDINHDAAMGGVPLIDDLVYLTSFMFQNGPCGAMCDDNPVVGCNSGTVADLQETDVNGDQTLIPDIADLVYLMTYMFQNGPEPIGWINYTTPACQ